MMNVRAPLKENTILKNTYKIKEIVSSAGSSCLVYKAHPILENGQEDPWNPLIIKEFYPMNWTLVRNSESNWIEVKYSYLKNLFQTEVEIFCSQAEFNNVSGYDKDTNTRFTNFTHMSSFKDNNTGYVVLSSIHGMTLEERMNLDAFSIRAHEGKERDALVELIDVMQCIIDAVKFQHQAGFLNLDLKPDNLLISKIGQSYLTHILDFGSSLSFGKDMETPKQIEVLAMRLSQSIGYSSPRLEKAYALASDESNTKAFLQTLEQLSPADDVYSLCKIFQEIIFGKGKDDCYKKSEKINWMNQIEWVYLKELLEGGQDVTKEYTLEMLQERLQQFKDILTREATSKKSMEDSIAHHTTLFFDMKKVQAFSQCGTVGSVFKIRKNEGENEIQVDVNFTETRTRKEIPDYAGIFYKLRPIADIRTLSAIEFEGRAIGQGLMGLQVEVKQPDKLRGEWMHEIFPISFSDSEQYETYTIYTKEFCYPQTLGCVEEITFVITADYFRDEEMLEGSFAIRNLVIK